MSRRNVARGRMTPARFASWRKRMGFDAPQAAEALGVQVRAVFRYESGERSISTTVALLCGCLETLRDME